MQTDNTEHKVTADTASPEQPVPASPSMFSSLWGLLTPRGSSSSPSPRTAEMHERQVEELKEQREEIKRIREQLSNKENELKFKVEEFTRMNEERRQTKERKRALKAAATPPAYEDLPATPVTPRLEEDVSVRFVVPAEVERKEAAEISVSIGDTSVFDASADELLESQTSTESLELRALQQRIEELTSEVDRLRQESEENSRKELAEINRLKQELQEERARAAAAREAEARSTELLNNLQREAALSLQRQEEAKRAAEEANAEVARLRQAEEERSQRLLAEERTRLERQQAVVREQVVREARARLEAVEQRNREEAILLQERQRQAAVNKVKLDAQKLGF